MCGFLETCGVGFCDGNDFTMTGASVACSLGFRYIVDGDWINLVEIRQEPREYNYIVINRLGAGFAKHSLFVVFVELRPF